MSQIIPHRGPGDIALTVLRHLVAIVLLVLVLTRVFNIVSDFRTASTDDTPVGASAETTESDASTETTADAGSSADEQGADEADADEPAASDSTQVVVVIIPGLNFRAEPKSGSEVMRTLPEGTRLALLGEQNGWYEVRDDEGVTGWVSSSSQYVSVEDAE